MPNGVLHANDTFYVVCPTLLSKAEKVALPPRIKDEVQRLVIAKRTLISLDVVNTP